MKLPAVCTGNWGCGAFGGDKQLKGEYNGYSVMSSVPKEINVPNFKCLAKRGAYRTKLVSICLSDSLSISHKRIFVKHGLDFKVIETHCHMHDSLVFQTTDVLKRLDNSRVQAILSQQ